MKQLLMLVAGFMPLVLTAQQTQTQANQSVRNPQTGEFTYDQLGRQVYLKSNIEENGTSFFGEKYCKANLKVRNGVEYPGMKVKVDLYDNSVIYIDKDGKEMVASSTVDKVQFYDCEDASKNKTLVSGFPPIDKQDESNFYVLLESGTVSLLKYIQVTFTEKMNNYGNANIVRTYRQNEFYYSYEPGKGMTKLSKDNDQVVAALAGKKKEVTDFLLTNHIKIRKEADLVKVFSYYNSLK